jgi:hypothetical protein
MKYLRDGLSTLASDLHGSCVVLLIDRRDNVVACITDRINSRKVFHSKEESTSWLSTTLKSHPTRNIDPAGVASFLMNRFICNERTIFEGVSVLGRSSVHQILPQRVCSEKYWSYDFDASYRGVTRSEEQWIGQLTELLEQAIMRRLPRQQGIALCSLSGGIDCRMILGLLQRQLQDTSRLKTLSYGFDSDDDVIVARQVSEHLGIDNLRACFNGDLAETIKLNGEICEGLVFFYTQGLAGMDLLREHGSQNEHANEYFVGDECFGWGEMPLSSFEDVLQKGIGIRAPVQVPAYYSYGNFRHGDIEEVMRSDIDSIRERCPPCRNWHDYKDFLYLDQRLANMILSWREFHAGRYTKVNNPLLDNDILDFMKSVPTQYRLDKLLFRKTMSRINPELSQLRYARSGGVDNARIDSLLLTQHKMILELINGYESKLDDVIPPDLIMVCLLDHVQKQRLGKVPMPPVVRNVADKLRRKFSAMRWYLGRGFAKTVVTERFGLMAVAPAQLEALIALRYFLKSA